MCQIIYRPSDHKLQMETLRASAEENRDGWGIMYHDGGIVVENGMTWGGFLEAYGAAPLDIPMGIHFRWKTHGKINIANTHPYSVLTEEDDGRALWVMHNGVISVPTRDPDMSDTWHWVDGILRPLARKFPGLLADESMKRILEETVDGSRLLLLDSAGEYTFLNPEYWTEEQGCAFSSTPAKSRSYVRGWEYLAASDWVKGADGVYRAKEASKLLTDQSVAETHIPYGAGEKYGEKPMDQDDWIDPGFFHGLGYADILQVVEDYPQAVADLLYAEYS